MKRPNIILPVIVSLISTLLSASLGFFSTLGCMFVERQQVVQCVILPKVNVLMAFTGLFLVVISTLAYIKNDHIKIKKVFWINLVYCCVAIIVILITYAN